MPALWKAARLLDSRTNYFRDNRVDYYPERPQRDFFTLLKVGNKVPNKSQL
jgi:predicted phage gp36 major capsid-like protein